MTEPDQFDGHLDQRLRRDRPAPSSSFTTRLRERLLERDAQARRPARLWLLVLVYVGSGVVLLLLAALGAAGGGPFGS
jgi:hypothetical protein